MMVGTMAEGATSGCVRVTPRFPMAALQARNRPTLIHWLAWGRPGLIGTSQPSLTLPALAGFTPRDAPA